MGQMDSFNIRNYFKRGKTVVLTLRHGEEELRQWADKDVADLLKLMKHFHPEFQNPRRKKKEVWDDVANELYKSGYTWSSEDCRKKWSNMIRTFKGIEEQRNDHSYSLKKLKWPLYDSMLHLLMLENADAFPEASAVIQLLNSDPSRTTGTTIFPRKVNNFKTLDSFAKFPNHHHQVHNETVQSTSEFLEQQRDDSINLVSEADLMDMGVSLSGHNDALAAEVQADMVNGMESNIIFTQPARYKTQPDFIVPMSSTSVTTLSSTISNKASLAVRTKKKPASKRKRNWKDSKVEDSIDTVLSKFIETTSKQNEEMLAKITSFHDNTLALMQERNGILRDIRDSLQNNGETDHNDGLVNVCHDSLEEEPQNTLTLHVGPAFSIASNDHTNGGAQLNSTLVIADPNATSTSTLSTFQLEDGTVLSGIDTSSVLPDVSLLHPGLMSVVAETGQTQSEMKFTMHNANAAIESVKH